MALIDELVKAFQVLPGVGQKTSQRMVLHLLQRNRNGGANLGDLLVRTMSNVRKCSKCQNRIRSVESVLMLIEMVLSCA